MGHFPPAKTKFTSTHLTEHKKQRKEVLQKTLPSKSKNANKKRKRQEEEEEEEEEEKEEYEGSESDEDSSESDESVSHSRGSTRTASPTKKKKTTTTRTTTTTGAVAAATTTTDKRAPAGTKQRKSDPPQTALSTFARRQSPLPPAPRRPSRKASAAHISSDKLFPVLPALNISSNDDPEIVSGLSNASLRTAILSILHTVELASTSRRNVRQRLMEDYRSFDFETPKKPLNALIGELAQELSPK